MRIPILLTLCLLVILTACDNNPESSIAFDDLPDNGDVVRGEDLFNSGASPACIGCHTEGSSASPDLDGFAERAGSEVDGESAREYAFYSITEPGRHVVSGFGNAMPNEYDDDLSAQDIADLIAYLLTR